MPISPSDNCLKKNLPRASRRPPRRWVAAIASLTFALISGEVCVRPVVVNSQAKIVKSKLTSSGKQHSYALFVPESVTPASPATPAPLILVLHGSGRDGLSQVERWKELASRDGIIIAGPDATTPMAWRMPVDGPGFLRDLVTELASKYPVDPRRVYLWGHSAGAEFALKMGLLESEYFAAVAIHAGALSPDEYNLTDYATRKIPMSVFVGTRDPIFPLTIVRNTVTALNAKGIATKLFEISGHDHNYYARANEINRAAWDFLKEQRLAGAPRFTEYNTRGNF